MIDDFIHISVLTPDVSFILHNPTLTLWTADSTDVKTETLRLTVSALHRDLVVTVSEAVGEFSLLIKY